MRKRRNHLLWAAALLLAFAAAASWAVHSNEVARLKASIPDVVQFYEENAGLFRSLRDIQVKYGDAGEDGYWAVSWNREGELHVLGLPQSGWDEVTLFNQEERRTIEAAFAASCGDISISHFDSAGCLWVRDLGRYYMEMMYFPDEELYQDWIENIWVVKNADARWLRKHWPVKYSGPVADGWYLVLIDGRPFPA